MFSQASTLVDKMVRADEEDSTRSENYAMHGSHIKVEEDDEGHAQATVMSDAAFFCWTTAMRLARRIAPPL